MMNFKLIVRGLISLLCLGGSICAAGEQKNARMNVLVLIGDDWRWDTLGCAGNPIVKTPALDALAKEGVLFTQMRVTTSLCSVSRASLFTGQWMSRHRCFEFGKFETPWDATYPGLLRKAGYWTGHVGKWHNGDFPLENFDFGIAYHGKYLLPQPDGSTLHVTRKNENDALTFLRSRPVNRPFCLTVAFHAPHAEDENPLQWIPQSESMKLYSDVTIPVPKTATETAFRALPPFIASDVNEARVRWRWRFDTPEKYQEMMRNYFRVITEVDTAIGHLCAELKAQGQYENTLIIFFGDNGYFYGEHGLADKWYPYEESMRIPLIVFDPRLPAKRRGSLDDNLVLNVDLAPLVVKAAGLNIPASMQGRDVSVLYLDKDKHPIWREEFYYEHPMILGKDRIPASEAVCGKSAKYINWPDFTTEEFFDLKNDPLEEHNQAANPGYASQVAEFRKKMAVLRQQAR